MTMSFVSNRLGAAVRGSTTRGARGGLAVTDPPIASVPAPGVGRGALAAGGVEGIWIVGSSFVPLHADSVTTAAVPQTKPKTVRRIRAEPNRRGRDQDC